MNEQTKKSVTNIVTLFLTATVPVHAMFRRLVVK